MTATIDRQQTRVPATPGTGGGSVSPAPATVELCRLTGPADVVALAGYPAVQIKVLLASVVSDLAGFRARGLRVTQIFVEDGVPLESGLQIRRLPDAESVLLPLLVELVEARREVLAEIGRAQAAVSLGGSGSPPPPLTPRRLRAMQPGERLRDSEGIGLFVVARANGRRCYGQRLRLAGRRIELGLGAFPALSCREGLAEARRQARHNHRLARAGTDPRVEKQRSLIRADVPTSETLVRDVFDQWFRKRAPVLLAERTRRQRRQWLDRWALPVIGNLPVGAVTAEQIADVLLAPSGEDRVLTGSAALGRNSLRVIFQWLDENRVLAVNPMKDPYLSKLPEKPKTHFPAASYTEVPRLFAAVRAATDEAIRADRLSHAYAGLAFQMAAVTFLRLQAITGACWQEVDREHRVWVIPAKRMKGAHAENFAVPLCETALRILDQAAGLPPADGETPYIFAYRRSLGRFQGQVLPLDRSHLARFRGAMGLAGTATTHGLRAPVTEWGTRAGFSEPVLEVVLAHYGGSTRRAYWRSDFWEERTDLVRRWDAFLQSGVQEDPV